MSSAAEPPARGGTAARPPGSNAPLAGRLLLWTRRIVLLYAVLGLGYLAWRFEVQTLPGGGVSPLVVYRPGAHLLVDKHSDGRAIGDALLFRDEHGRLLLGRVAERPAGEARPGAWIVSDRDDTSLPDSRTLGPVPRERIAGRVVCAIPAFD